MDLNLLVAENNVGDLSRRRMGIFLKTLRKSLSMTQLEMANIIQCTQSSVSKFEEGVMELSAIEMIRLCKELEIQIEVFSKFYIDSKKLAGPSVRKGMRPFKIPKKYDHNCVYNIRGVNPLIHYAKYKLSEDKFNEFALNEMGIDPSYFLIMDSQINSTFIDDLSCLVDFKQDDFYTFFQNFFKTNKHHGECHENFIHSKSKIDAIREYVKCSGLYDFAINRMITIDSPDRLDIIYKYQDSNTIEDLITNYHSIFLELMATYSSDSNLNVSITRKIINHDSFLFEVEAC